VINDEGNDEVKDEGADDGEYWGTREREALAHTRGLRRGPEALSVCSDPGNNSIGEQDAYNPE